MTVEIKNRRAVEENRGESDPESDCGLHIGAEGAIHNVSAQREQGEDHSRSAYRSVIPAELRRSTHEPGGHKDAQSHNHQEHLADEEGQ